MNNQHTFTMTLKPSIAQQAADYRAFKKWRDTSGKLNEITRPEETDSFEVRVSGFFRRGYADTYLQPGEPDMVEIESITRASDGIEVDVTDDQLEQLENDWLACFYDIKADVAYDGEPFDVDPYSGNDDEYDKFPAGPNINPFDVPTQYETECVNRHGIMPNAVTGNWQPEETLTDDEYSPTSFESKLTFTTTVKLEILSNFGNSDHPIKWLCDTGCDCGCPGCDHADKNRYVAYGRGSKDTLETAVKQYIQHCKNAGQ